MQPPAWLSEPMSVRAFSLRAAAEQGIGRHRQDSPALRRPFKGVRALQEATSAEDHARSYLPRLRNRQVFGGVTALRLLGLPWITPWWSGEPLELTVPGDAYTPRSRGVRAMRLSERRFATVMVDDLPTLSPIAAVMSVADRLTHHQLVGVMDALICRSKNYPRLRWRPMCASVEDLHEAVEEWGPSPGRSRARAALPLVRLGPESFPESMVRLVLTDSGLPEPELHPAVATEVGTLRPDGGWSDCRVAYEYEGDQHRTEKLQWDADISRMDALVAAGWRVLRLTSRDLQQPELLCRRVGDALRSAGCAGV